MAESSTTRARVISSDAPDASTILFGWVWLGIALYAIAVVIKNAYNIRLSAINEFGPVIHEFDPYFNYRATEYLYEHGAKKFFQWFDYMVWYPLGRPVGTTIYPGMQFTAVWIKRYILSDWSLNDVCCYVPAWFGAIASGFVGLIAYECTIPANSSSNLVQWVWDLVLGKPTELKPVTRPMVLGLNSPSVECGVFAMAMMAVVPAHLMRSVGGGYDNESVAVSAMCLTFYLWIRSLRDEASSWLGIATAFAYFYMVAAWGGYVFVLNLIGVHAALLLAGGRFSLKLYRAYSLFYLIGTALAMQVPVVGWMPLKSLEQLGPCAVFLAFQLLQLTDMIKGKKEMSRVELFKLRAKVFAVAIMVAIILVMALVPNGYFGPLSSRVRGLFVQHTKTGNPLVDSVAEHQPANSRAYFRYLHHVCSLAPIGFLMVMANLSDSSSFLLVWAMAAYFFSLKMVRLVLLTAPIGSALAGVAAGRLFAWCVRQWWDSTTPVKEEGTTPAVEPEEKEVKPKKGASKRPTKGKKPSKKAASTSSSGVEGFDSFKLALDSALASNEGVITKRTLACLIILLGYILGMNFAGYCWKLSGDLSNPSIIIKARLRDGTVVKVDDYREAYWWLRDNTPEDSRIMAWWDYGYQITAISNRTTLADGNTWNHEHIALLGKALTSSEEEGYQIARHLADYVLVWGGGGGDDLAKSPHLARIANSVYRDHCPAGDTACRSFGFIDREGTPSPMMERSLLYRLHGHKVKKGVEADPSKWQEVFRSKYGRVRIYKILNVAEESKQWVQENVHCDTEGSWFCPGSYPPGLADVLAHKRDFAQLEDFNRGAADSEYQKQYFEGLNDPKAAVKAAQQARRDQELRAQKSAASMSENREQARAKTVDEIYNTWEDTETTTAMWTLINNNQVDALREWLERDPTAAFIRSRDGRGPMWWAFEQRRDEITKLLMSAGVPHTDRDSKGLTPADVLEGRSDSN
eukprot:Nitzschia sp. Nitz4//scaffold7_size249615//51352//54449//NITZ4_001152-RA/size249615-augustus-gene-0.252-mRNA-1//-1//CDS//3329558367//4125//frame0